MSREPEDHDEMEDRDEREEREVEETREDSEPAEKRPSSKPHEEFKAFVGGISWHMTDRELKESKSFILCSLFCFTARKEVLRSQKIFLFLSIRAFLTVFLDFLQPFESMELSRPGSCWTS